MVLLLLLVACGSSGGETVDVIYATYRGFPADGSLEDGVSVENPDTIFKAHFFGRRGELWTTVSIEGAMVIHGIRVENQSDTIEGVTVDGASLSCTLTIQLIEFQVDGTFSPDRTKLLIDVGGIGSMDLDRDPPNQPA